jgi:NADH dehydrogenase
MIHHMKATYTEPPPWLTIQEDKAIGLDITKQQVQGSKKTYAYDSLVIATGSEAHDFGVPGVKKHCLMCKTGEDIEAINAKEKAKGAFVLGAGPTGVELACKLWSQGVQVKLVEAADTILPGFSQEMQRRVTEYLEDAEIQVLKGQPISAITDKEIILKNIAIPYSSDQQLIWTCGIKPEAFVRSLTGGGGLVVNEGLCYKKNVYAIGDAIKGHGPSTAQNAVQQGTYLAEQFNQKRTEGSYTYREKGRVLDLSHCMFVEVFGTVWYVPYLMTDIVRMALK